MIFDTDNRETLELARQNPYRPRTDDPASAGELFTAGFDQLVSEEQSISAWRWNAPYVKQRRERIQKLIGSDPDPLLTANFGMDSAAQAKLSGFLDAGEIRVGRMLGDAPQSTDWLTTGLPVEVEFESERARKWAQKNRDAFRALLYIRALKEQDPEILTDDEILEQIAQRTAIMRESNQEVTSRAQGILGHGAAFAGAALGAVTDPPILLTMPLGGAAIRGPSIGWNAAKAFGIEAGIATAVEVPVQANVYGFKRQIDSPWSAGQASFNVLAAAVGAGTIRASASAAIDAGTVLARRTPLRLVEAERIITEHLNAPLNIEGAARMLENYRGAVVRGLVDPTPETDRAARELEAFVEIGQENRLGPDRTETHFDRVEAAMDDVAAARPTDAMIGPEEVPVLGGRPGRAENLVVLDPDIIEVDAARFQFKHGADELGVTDRLKGVERFDRLLAGIVVAYEDRAGRFFIVDGHQRLALARRARAAGQDPTETRLTAHVLREADGVTPSQARQAAAIKNIAEGTGSGVDAAKVLREVGPAGEALLPPLPPNSALVRNARGLAKLDDESFQLVINDVIPEGYAAIVGERIPDPRQQAAVIRLLARTDPANANQARMIVEQARAAGFETRTTEDLFGETTIAESYYIERAKVLDAAMRAIRKDRQAFKTAVSRGTTLEEAGNVLNQEANAARLAADDELLTAIGVTANQRGPVSDALNVAARRVRDGERPAAVVDDFLGTLRAEGLRDGPPGAPAGGARSPEQVKAREFIESMMREGEEFAAAAGIAPPVRALPDDHPLLVPRDADNSPERVALRKALIDERFEGATPVPAGEQKIAYLMGGGGASGKGTVKKYLIANDEIPGGALHLDPDEFKTGARSPHSDAEMRGIPEYDEIIGAGDSRAAMVTHEESSRLYKDALARGIEGNYHLVLDRTLGNGERSVAELQRLVDAGYEIRLVGVSLDTETAFLRAVERAQRTGRYVPLRAMVDAHKGFAASWDRLAAAAQRVELYDNNVAKGADPILAARRGADGKALQIIDPAMYNRFVRKATEEIDLEQAAQKAGRREEAVGGQAVHGGDAAQGPGDGGAGARVPGAQEPEGRAGDLSALRLTEAGAFRTGEPVTFDFVRNPERAPRPGPDDAFAQNIEPRGRYMNERTTDPGQVPEGLEQGSVTFERPLVIEYGDSTRAWKERLSEAYGGATGEDLSRAIARDGYDGIVTVETRRGQANTSEIVDLTAFADTAPPARAAPEMDLFGPAPVREQVMADAQRAVDERLGAGREAVPAESRGDLFDLNRERQVDLTDARIQRVAQERGLDMPTLERAELEELDRLLREEGQVIELPDRIELDADGNPQAIGRRADEVFSELDSQARALEAIELCTVGSAA